MVYIQKYWLLLLTIFILISIIIHIIYMQEVRNDRLRKLYLESIQLLHTLPEPKIYIRKQYYEPSK